MVKHIVLWKLKDMAEGRSAQENALMLKGELESLRKKIKEIVFLQVGLNFNSSEAAYDVALYSEFKTKQDLLAYQKHPEHVKVAELVNKVREKRVVVDYED